MVVTLVDDAPSYSMVKKWVAEFKRGGDSPRRPVTVTTQETIAKIHYITITDRRVTEYYIVTELGISQDRIHAVILNELHMSKLSAHCVPKFLGLGSGENRIIF